MNNQIILQEKWQLRAPVLADLVAVSDLCNRYTQDMLGINTSTPETLRSEWHFPNISLSDDFRVVMNDDNAAIGYAVVWNHGTPYSRAHINIIVDPTYKNQGLEHTLLDWAENRAVETFAKAPDEAMLILMSETYHHEAEQKELLAEVGYQKTRNFWTMKIELDQAIPAPQFLENIEITTHAELGDLRGLIVAVDDSFRDHWGYVPQPIETALEKWAHWSNPANNPHYDGTMWFLAMDGDEIAAISLCAPSSPEDETMGYVYTLGVRRQWRRQGLALALLHHSFRAMQTRGLKSAALDVDAQSLTGANRLYDKAGMHVWRHSEDFEKVIRDGIDYRTHELED